MSKLYLIYGTTGEYSDYEIWNVGIVQSREVAKKYVDFMNDRLKGSGNLKYKEQDKLAEELSQFDDKIRIDYTGAEYGFDEFELDELPAKLIPKTTITEKIKKNKIILEIADKLMVEE